MDKEFELLLASFALRFAPDETKLEEIAKLNSILRKIGAEIVIIDGDSDLPLLSVICRTAVAEKALKRGAGRKRHYPTGDLLVKDVRRMVDEIGADETATKLGISRSTLFRRLKQDEEFFF